MLILTRFEGQSIQIGPDIIVTLEGVSELKAAALRVRRGIVEKTAVLSLGETWQITEDISVTNAPPEKSKGAQSSLGITAPRSVGIFRTEVAASRRFAHQPA
jgi:sRNA-binding carbon storage regulator CsrA